MSRPLCCISIYVVLVRTAKVYHSSDHDIPMCRDVKRKHCSPSNSKQHSIHAIGTHSKEGCELDSGRRLLKEDGGASGWPETGGMKENHPKTERPMCGLGSNLFTKPRRNWYEVIRKLQMPRCSLNLIATCKSILGDIQDLINQEQFLRMLLLHLNYHH